MAQEIERKFILSEEYVAPLIANSNGVVIQQGYLAIGQDSEARIRSYDDAIFNLTVKTAGELVRGEFEIEISREQFGSLWASTEGRRIEKTRYTVPISVASEGEEKLEIDRYAGKLAGLIIGEIEFESPDLAAAFQPPDGFMEVTSDKRYKNQQLAVQGFPRD